MASELVLESNPTRDHSQLGLLTALTLISLWLISLIGCFAIAVPQTPILVVLAGMLVRSFLQTGLFITTHEAIHGLVSRDREMNNAIGHLTATFYALLPYDTLAYNHHQHHRYPATEADPDFYPGDSTHFLGWYIHFMKQYHRGQQAWILLAGMTVVFWMLMFLNVDPINLALFWVIPILISSLQLFTFGIFLPHRQTETGYCDRHRTRSSQFSPIWSFLACYHFGYHWEHHQYPHLPWFKLPRAHQ